MKSHCMECSFSTEEPGELYIHFMNEHTKIIVTPTRCESYSLESYAGWSF